MIHHLFNLEMSENVTIADHINKFSLIVSQLSFPKIDFDDKIRPLILTSSLSEASVNIISKIRSLMKSEMLS